ncbi:MAG: DUF5615 family PIN-like protein [Candidatus Jordarchaeaceae archaeon]
MGHYRESNPGEVMKFLVDMSISPKTVELLKRKGYEAVRVSNLGMAKSRDEEILGYAIEKDMVLLTADLDFGNILAYTKSKRPSTIIFRLKNPSPEFVNQMLLLTLPKIEEQLKKGVIVVVEDTRIRIRELPLIGTKQESEFW